MPDDEFTLRKAMERATQAQQLLENPLLIDFFKTYRESLFEVWEQSPPRDDEGRKALYLALQCLGKMKGHFETFVANGRLANSQIERDYLTPRKRFGIV